MRIDDEVRAAQELRAAVDQLPREVRPARDLWPEIADRLDERPPWRAASWVRLAAALALVALGLLAAEVLRPGARTSPPVLTRAAQPAGPTMAAARLRQQDGVLHAHSDLVAVVARQRGRLDEAGAGALAAGLADLERATGEIEAALADNPGGRRLRLALAAAYRRESAWAGRFGDI